MKDIKNVDLNLYKVFLTVAKSGSISKAAEVLYVSQPAVSYSIKTLEEELNCRLFNRTSKGVELTADAHKLMFYVENAYNTLQTGFKILNDSNDLLQGEIRIGVPTHICIFLVSDIIESFTKEYPGIKFFIANKSTAEMVDMLEKRMLDIIIDSYPIDSVRADVTLMDLLYVDNCFVAEKRYSNLTTKKLSLHSLERYPLLLQPKTTSTRKALENSCLISGEDLETNIEVATTEVMLDLVMKGLGIGYFSKMAVADKLQSGELVEIQVKEELPKTKICMAYIKDFLTNAPKKFADVIKEKTQDLNCLKQKTMRLILLQDCVYNCDFCHKEGIKNKRDSLMSPDDIAYIFRILKKQLGLDTVQLTGGEPLLKPDLKEIITKLKLEGARIKLTTNGYLIKENMWIGEMIDKLNISIHTLEETKYEDISKVKGSYHKLIDAIKQLRFRYPTLKININTTLLKEVNSNLEELEEIIKFASSIKANLKLVEVYPKESKYFISIDKIVPKIQQLGYKNIENTFRKKIYNNGKHTISIQRCTCSVVSESEEKEKMCKYNNDIYISQDGKINICRNTDEVLDLYPAIKNNDDIQIVNIIKESYKNMGKNCNC